MNADVLSHIRSCQHCAEGKTPTGRGCHTPGHIATPPRSEGQCIHIDWCKMPRNGEYDCILTIIDRCTHFVVFVPCRTTDTCSSIIQSLELNWVSWLGMYPHTIISDNEVRLGHLFKRWCRVHNIEHKTTTNHHPQSNGLCETQHRTLLLLLRTHLREQRKEKAWIEALPFVQRAINSTAARTGVAPYDALYGRERNIAQSCL